MRKLFVSIVLLFISVSPSYGQVCFDQVTADRMVVELQSCRFTEQELTFQEKKNLELMSMSEKQTLLAKETEAKFKACSAALGKTDQLMKDKDAACDERVRQAKPSLWSMISGALGFFSAGILIGLLL